MKKLLFASASLALASVSSFAATISYSTSFPLTPTDFSSPLAIQQFDPAFGSLTSLSITLTGASNGSGVITNNNSKTKTYDVHLSTDLTLTDPLANTLVEILPLFESIVNVPGNGGMVTATGIGTASVTNSYNDGATLTEFTGTGNLIATIAGDGASGFSGASNTSFNSNTSASGTVDITYTYDSPPSGIPEPATMGVLGFSLVGLGFFKFRRKT